MAEKIIVKLPMDILELSGLNSVNLEEKSVLIWVIELYSEGKVSLSRAAKLVGMNNDEFIKEFQRRKLKRIGGPESIEEAEEELKNLSNALKEGKNDYSRQ